MNKHLCGLLAAAILAPLTIAASASEPIRLAAALPAVAASNAVSDASEAAPRSGATDIFTGQRGNKTAYNAQFLGLTAVVAADDNGLYKTLYTKSGSSANKIANDFTHLGDLTYVAPALGVVYLSGGSGNQRLAYHAALAVAKAGALGLVLKYAVGRQRPHVDQSGSTTFKPGSTSDDNNSFPSGHAIVAFSVATVWAHERPNERVLAYGLASLVGLSRIALSAHWPSDVLAGAALGVAQGRQVNNGNTELFSLRF